MSRHAHVTDPNHRNHVSFVVHETGIEVRSIVARRAGDVSEATGEWILQEMEHRKEFAWWHEHVVTEPAGDDRVVHDWLVWLVLEVAVPSGDELWEWPALEFFKFLLVRADLHTRFDAIGSEWASAVDVPLIEHLVLRLLITTDEVVERLGVGLGTVGCKGKIVVLEVQTNTREVDQRLDTRLAELLWVT